MTEERMICKRTRTVCYPHSEDGSTQLQTGGIECWTRWIPVEPAPPKDWKPDCYEEVKCQTYESELPTRCDFCLYRKKDD